MAKDTFQFKKLTYNADLPYDKIECPLLRSLHLDLSYESTSKFETQGTLLYITHGYIGEYARNFLEFVVYKGIMYKYKGIVNSQTVLFEPV